jgi:hypothetical protein
MYASSVNDARYTEVHTAEPSVPVAEITTDQISVGLIQPGSR